MGVGSYLSRYIHDHLLVWFVRLELIVGLVGGFSGTLLFISHSRGGPFQLVLVLLLGVVGMGVGLE
ncbi:MAG: spermidine synthase, partial [Myxococcota bacterium]